MKSIKLEVASKCRAVELQPRSCSTSQFLGNAYMAIADSRMDRWEVGWEWEGHTDLDSNNKFVEIGSEL